MRLFPRSLKFVTACVLLAVISWMDVAPAVAGLAPSQTSGSTTIGAERDADLLIIERALENRLVAQKLRDYGVQPEDVQIRLASMTDEDVHTLASATRGLPSGSDGVGLLIGILLVVLLVVLILKLMNREIVVK